MQTSCLPDSSLKSSSVQFLVLLLSHQGAISLVKMCFFSTGFLEPLARKERGIGQLNIEIDGNPGNVIMNPNHRPEKTHMLHVEVNIFHTWHVQNKTKTHQFLH